MSARGTLMSKKFWQMAWLVDDLDEAVRHWQDTADVGPFFIGQRVGGMLTDARHRGRPMDLDIGCAVAQAGPVQIELIKQHDGAPSPYRDVYAEGESGFHHIASIVDDVEAECRRYEKNGVEVAMTALVAGETPIALVDTRPMFGCMTELMQPNDLVSRMCLLIAQAAADWDGSDPVRDFSVLMDNA